MWYRTFWLFLAFYLINAMSHNVDAGLDLLGGGGGLSWDPPGDFEI